MNIVVLDAQRANPGDLSWDKIKRYGNLTVYPSTEKSKIVERAKDMDIILTNKGRIDHHILKQLPRLKLICQVATGYDNVDVTAARAADITVCNAVGYSTNAVAQHVFALLLHRTNQVADHNAWVQKGNWANAQWSHTLNTIKEVTDSTFGIYGFGKIGQRVAQLAMALGMNVIAHHKHPVRDAQEGISFVSLKELFKKSDVISLHAPLSDSNRGIINTSLLQQAKSDALLINTGRGGLINEEDLKQHLLEVPTFAAALDVLSQEPPPKNHPLIGLSNCTITPHNAWASLEARGRLIDIVAENIKAYINGHPKNVVN